MCHACQPLDRHRPLLTRFRPSRDIHEDVRWLRGSIIDNVSLLGTQSSHRGLLGALGCFAHRLTRDDWQLTIHNHDDRLALERTTHCRIHVSLQDLGIGDSFKVDDPSNGNSVPYVCRVRALTSISLDLSPHFPGCGVTLYYCDLTSYFNIPPERRTLHGGRLLLKSFSTTWKLRHMDSSNYRGASADRPACADQQCSTS